MIGLNHIFRNWSGCLVFAENPPASLEGPQPVRGHTHLWHPPHLQEVIKPTLNPTASRRLLELVEGCCAWGYGYHRERGELRLRREKESTGQGPREAPDAEFPGVLFLQSHGHVTSLALTMTERVGYRQPGQLPWALVFRIFIRAPIRRNGWLPAWLAFVSSPSRGWTVCTTPPPSTTLLVSPHPKSHRYTIQHDSWANKDTPSRHSISRV